ncbi:MAG TPA: hypothetical protein VKS82_15855 [Streptosporangiaceae bacterium]|nr:hypothetical protein [Streptosporangiaceae bacterium]
MTPGPWPGGGEPRPEILERSPGWRAVPLLNRVPRWLFTVAAAALLAGGGAVLVTSQARHPPATVAPASHIVFMPSACAPFINLTGRHVPTGYRVILGDAFVPPAYLGPQGTGPQDRPGPWRYGWKMGFGFRGGGLPVTISVPAAWRGRLALFGGPAGSAYTSQLRIPSCPYKGLWNTFVSSFFLHTWSGCVPLEVQVGRLTGTVWFGLSRHCPGRLLTGRS